MAWRRSGDKPLSESMLVSLRYALLGLNELMREIHQSSVESRDKGPVTWALMFFYDVSLSKLLNK